jgi:hypothetical protein
MTCIRNRLRAQQGTAMVEMALVLPILLALALGIVDFGKAMNYWNDANQLAADAARYAAVNKNPGADNADPADDDFRDWIRLQADSGELQDGTVASDTSPSGREDSESTPRGLHICIGKPGQGTLAEGDLAVGKPIEVVVETSYNLIPFVDHIPFLSEDEDKTFGQVKIRGTAVMRLEQNYTMATGCKWAP